MKRPLFAALGVLVFAPGSFAIVDQNENGISDLWERAHNDGEPFPETFDPQADPDGDGWTNAEEAAAGTNPFDPNPPDGLIRPEIVQVSAVLSVPDAEGHTYVITPQAVTVTWPTLIGKQYTLLFSPDLSQYSWMPVGDSFIGNGSDVTYGFEINGSDKRFWRVAATDGDADGDVLTDHEEHLIGTDPSKADTDGDGIPDADEVTNNTSAILADTDGDGIPDGQDADPADILVDWKRAPESPYILIEVESPSDERYAQDLNDKAEVLFSDGVWSNGVWDSRQIAPITGPTDLGTFESEHESWTHFTNDQHLVGYGSIWYLTPHGENVDQESTISWKPNQSPVDLAGEVTFWNYVNPSMIPIGVTSTGRIVGTFRYLEDLDPDPEENDYVQRYKLAVISSTGGLESFLPMPADDQVHYTGSYPSSRVSPSGWVTSLLSSPSTGSGTSYRIALWNPQFARVAMPTQAEDYYYKLNLTELAGNRIALAATIGADFNTQVFASSATGALPHIPGLSDKHIQTLAPDGTGMTSDGKLWRNGKLVPMRDLNSKWKELEDSGYSLLPLKSNANSTYLIQAFKDNQTEQKTFIAFSVAIVPDVNMAGVLGDTVDSLVPGSTIKHFVSPKKSSAIAQDYVILKATGRSVEQITPGNQNQLFEWVGGEIVPNEPLKRRVRRDVAARTEVKIKSKKDGSVSAQTNAWVIWADATPVNGVASFANYLGGARYEVDPNQGWRFKFAIQPNLVLDQTIAERPRLSGIFRKPPPGAGKLYTLKPSVGDGDTSTKQWDLSRQYKVTIRNPGGISKADLQNGFVPAAWIVNQPAAIDVPVPFPGLDVEGNDDPLDGIDEDANPYVAYAQSPKLNHLIGELSSYDAPGIRVLDGWGAPDRAYSVELNFREFARLEIWDGKRMNGQFWFRISDHINWHHYLNSKFDYEESQWKNELSSSGLGHPKP